MNATFYVTLYGASESDMDTTMQILATKILTVQSLADALHLSPGYLTNLSVGEIARTPGFEHPQSFNKLFNKEDQRFSP
ncbi:MAG: hypothetical protein K8S54_15000 [Spirochaetia bacterium]|nr:hypothetical protein [Spirochaetia bacterium]